MPVAEDSYLSAQAMADLDLEEELLQVAGRKRPRAGARDLSDDGEAGSSTTGVTSMLKT